MPASRETLRGIQDLSALVPTEKPSRPVLRWHGGKWVLAPWIIRHFPEHRVYTEAFGGAGSVLMKKKPSFAEIWNDAEDELVTLFRVLRDRGQARRLIRALYLTPFSRAEFDLSYVQSEDPVEASRRLVVRSYMGFGSNAQNKGSKTGFRSNSNRSHTTPAHDWANYPRALSAIVRRLRTVVIENREAGQIIARHDGPQTLHYVDPPYVHSTRGAGHDAKKRYSKELFDHDHESLAGLLNDVKGMVVLSGYKSALYDRLYSGWKTYERKAMADGARERVEVLWLNPAAQSRLGARSLWD